MVIFVSKMATCTLEAFKLKTYKYVKFSANCCHGSPYYFKVYSLVEQAEHTQRRR